MPLGFRCGSIAVAFWRAPVSSAHRTRGFLRTGSTPMCGAARCVTPSASTAASLRKQVRDCLHPRDLAALLDAQMQTNRAAGQRIFTAGGGQENAMSLAQLNAWCDARFGPHAPKADLQPRRYDIPWVVMDNCDVQRTFGWRVEVSTDTPYSLKSPWACRGQSGLAGEKRFVKAPAARPDQETLHLLSVVIPARDEEGRIGATVEHLYVELRLHGIEHEIVVVDDGSTDATWKRLEEAKCRVPTLRPIQNTDEHGFGRAITFGLDHIKGDAVVIMMADESDDCRDVVRYWQILNEGWDAVFGSRASSADGGVIELLPPHKLFINRLAKPVFFV